MLGNGILSNVDGRLERGFPKYPGAVIYLLSLHHLPCRHNDYKVASPALRAVGNIVTGDDIQTQVRGIGTFYRCSWRGVQLFIIFVCSKFS